MYNYGKITCMSAKFPNFIDDDDDSDYITEEERKLCSNAMKEYLQFGGSRINSQKKGDDHYPQERSKNIFVANPFINVDLDQDPHQEDSFKRAGLQTSVMTRLIGGKIRPQTTLDMHGMQVAEAGQELVLTINNARGARHECVKVIHGKGYTRSNSNYGTEAYKVGKLKLYVMAWLKDNAAVLGFCRAPANEGGSGATYILLSKS